MYQAQKIPVAMTKLALKVGILTTSAQDRDSLTMHVLQPGDIQPDLTAAERYRVIHMNAK